MKLSIVVVVAVALLTQQTSASFIYNYFFGAGTAENEQQQMEQIYAPNVLHVFCMTISISFDERRLPHHNPHDPSAIPSVTW